MISFLQLIYFFFLFFFLFLFFRLDSAFRCVVLHSMDGWGDGGEESLALEFLSELAAYNTQTHIITLYHDMGRFWSRSFRESVDLVWLMKT